MSGDFGYATSMPLVPAADLMSHALRHRYAVGYFESWDVASLQGVIDAAEQWRAPVIIGFNGEFLSGVNRRDEERLEWYAALGRAAAESAAVPCAFIFNECSRDDWVRRAVTAGFNLIMPADPDAPVEQYTQRVTDITGFAHDHDIAVEAELGELPGGHDGAPDDRGSVTDPAAAARFVEATGVDLLAVSVGNVHILIRGERSLDLERIASIRQQVSVPLVLHGGTGIAADALREAIALGVAKVNYGTVLKQRYLAAVRAALSPRGDGEDPHHLLGIGGEDDVLVAGRRAVRDAVHERMELLGCRNRAALE